jgi:topoisomerase-4 subunit A
VSLLLLDGIDENAVDFRPTYDGSEMEPIVLPGGFPNLLANGSSGIAVGMATKYPAAQRGRALRSHGDDDRLGERGHGKDLVKIVTGPDFPTGGTLVEDRKDIITAYETGRGSFRVPCEVESRGAEARDVSDCCYRDSLPGAEIEAGREDCRV